MLAIFAHIIKGVTGFGPAIVFVSVGTIIHNPIDIIVLASFLDIVGGGYLSYLNPQFFENRQYWLPIGTLMIVGAGIGAVSLSELPPDLFEIALGVSIIIIAIWFLVSDSDATEEETTLQSIDIKDGSVGIFSGFCGGFTGMGGPPLIAYFNTKFNKKLFRAIIVPIFLMAAIARFISYGALGMIQPPTFWIYLALGIGVLIGNYIGNEFFEHIEQNWFTVLVGIILLLSGIRLLVA